MIMPGICFCSGFDICTRYPQLSTTIAESSILNTVKGIVGALDLSEVETADAELPVVAMALA